MTLSRRLVEKVAVCSGRFSSNNYLGVSSKDIESTALERGEEVRVVLIRTDLERDIKPVDRDTYSTTLAQSGQVYVPKSTREKLDMEPGDIMKYIIIPKNAFPGLMDGPIRGKAREILSEEDEGIDGESIEEDIDEGDRDTTVSSFSASMQKTGQVTVPSSVREEMDLRQGDMILATIMWQDDELSSNKEIGTGNRITITQSERDRLGLEPGDQPEIRIAVF